MAISAFCYSLNIPNGTDLIGKSLRYLPYGGNTVTISLDNLNLEASTDGNSTTYYFCSRTYPILMEFGNQSDFSFYGMTVGGGSSQCTSNADCFLEGGGGSGATDSYCYQIEIDTAQVAMTDVEFMYTPVGAQFSTLTLASNWSNVQTNGNTKTLYLCSSSSPTIWVYGDPTFDPSIYGITISGGTSLCTADSDCSPSLPPTNCVLSNWGYGATQETWVQGAWSPCTLTNGSYQQYQTRYVITPATNGGTCVGATIQYQACSPTQSGSTATLTTPTFSSTTATSTTVTTTISNNGGSDVTQVVFRLLQNGTPVAQQSLTSFNLGISVTFTGLSANTTYTAVAYATNSTGTSNSSAGTVTTSGASGVGTPVISSVTQTSATSTSTFTNPSNEQYSRYGIIYKIGNSDNLTVNSPGVIKIETGPFVIGTTSLVGQLSGLTPSLQYYVKTYVQSADGSTYLYSSAANFTTTAVQQGTNFAALDISSIALQGSLGTAEDYNYITNSPSVNIKRSYVSIIEESGPDPIPGAYRLTANLQQANLNSLMWIVYTKTSPAEQDWTSFSTVMRDTDLNTIATPPGWTYYTYAQDRTSMDFRPRNPGYYRVDVKGVYNDGTGFTASREVVIGKPTADTDLAYSTLRQLTPSNIQVVTNIDYPEWIPEFPEDAMYGISVTQSGSTIIPTLNINNTARSFSALWAANVANEMISPTLTVNYTSPFKDLTKSNSFSKQFTVDVLAPYPIISFSNPSIFSSPITSGGNVTISVSTQYAKSYTISSTLGTGDPDSPVTYSNVQVGTYTITATATNDNMPTAQSTSINATLTVEAAAPILAQLPQQQVGRNLYVDINTLPFINLNGSSFNSLAVVTPPSQGTVAITNYIMRYIPNTDYTGTDLFSFRVKGPNGVVSNIINVSLLITAPSFRVGTANETIVFDSTEVNASRDIVIPITNTSTTNTMTIHSITIDQDSTDFILRVTSGQTESDAQSISDIELDPLDVYEVKIRATPTAIGVRTAKLKIDHN